jgi:hypothetical protein
MKYLILIISLFSFNSIVFSQDSISVRTEIDTFSPANYEGQYDYVFARKEPEKQFFKLGFLFGLYGGGHTEIMSYERKIAKDVSIHLSFNSIQGFGLPFGGRFFSNDFQPIDEKNQKDYNTQPQYGLAIEPRWYFNMKKGIRNGLIADNFHGSYVGLRNSLEIQKYYDFSYDNQTQVINAKEYHNYFITNELTIGTQRRILASQYLDFSIGTGVRTRFKTGFANNSKVQWLLNYRLAYGFILNKLGKKSTTSDAKCAALRCFENENSMWKIGLTNLINLLNEKQFRGTLSIAYEQKIPNTVISVENRIAFQGSIYSKSLLVEKNQDKYVLELSIMPRYYYDLKRRIAKGISANNMSGEYVGIKLDYNRTQKFNDLIIQGTGVTGVWGMQQRILKHLNFDTWIGYGAVMEKTSLESKLSHGLVFNFLLSAAF